MRPIMRHEEEGENDGQQSSPAHLTSRERAHSGSRTPTSDNPVPQYIPKVKSCAACRQQKVLSEINESKAQLVESVHR
jgi:hypothetical protein